MRRRSLVTDPASPAPAPKTSPGSRLTKRLSSVLEPITPKGSSSASGSPDEAAAFGSAVGGDEPDGLPEELVGLAPLGVEGLPLAALAPEAAAAGSGAVSNETSGASR